MPYSPNLDKIIAILKASAAEELLPRFMHVERTFKSDGSIVTEADTAMQARISQALRQCWPEIPLLGEEMPGQQQKSLLADNKNGLWLLDPLDGTSNFAAGIPYFCVSLALLKQGVVELAVVYDPLRQECYSASSGRGAWLNGKPLRVTASQPELQQTMGLVDFKRLSSSLATRLAISPPYSSQRSFGSGALDWCMIASGRCQLYLHGGQKLWDYAAGQLILSEAGGYSATLDGQPVLVSSLETRSVVAACSLSLFNAWQSWLKE